MSRGAQLLRGADGSIAVLGSSVADLEETQKSGRVVDAG